MSRGKLRFPQLFSGRDHGSLNGLGALASAPVRFTLAASIFTLISICPISGPADALDQTGPATITPKGHEASNTGSNAVGTLIRCPDWTAYAAPVHLASVVDRRTRPSLDERLAAQARDAQRKRRGKSRTSAPGATHAPGTASPGKSEKGRADRTASCPPHTVQAGDTLSAIAASRLGSPGRWRTLQAANGGISPKRLNAGMVLTIPCRGSDAGGHASLAAAGPGGTATKPAEPPKPVWTAQANERFATVLKRWAKRAGHTVIIDTTDAWRLDTPVRLRGAFHDVVAQLVRGLAHNGTAPPVRIHPNKVVRVGL